ncbi:hypothetical protein B0H67DRAFT_557758 [Lasiosphaeris hirsuta]|uniref:Uncharacterized protein n=1 Tax=Lasiosphaeris hirsuta TaxID=260670 RepID=A0AA39ZWR3_9PEZI|nr:hypothetical protein B0H67DRAFT_557758 [Lasiosphaeris hirsuta]
MLEHRLETFPDPSTASLGDDEPSEAHGRMWLEILRFIRKWYCPTPLRRLYHRPDLRHAHGAHLGAHPSPPRLHPRPDRLWFHNPKGVQLVISTLDAVVPIRFIGFMGLVLIVAPTITHDHPHLVRGAATRFIGIDGTNYINHLRLAARSLWLYHEQVCGQRPRLKDLGAADLVVLLASSPDLFTHPWLRWMNPYYHTLRNWRRWHAAAYAYVDLERAGALDRDAGLHGFQPNRVYNVEMLEEVLASEAGWMIIPREAWWNLKFSGGSVDSKRPGLLPWFW